MIDTHAHIHDEAFDADREEVLRRAKAAGVDQIFLPATDYQSCLQVLALCSQKRRYADGGSRLAPTSPLLSGMIGLHPEEVRDDYRQQLGEIKALLDGLSQASLTTVWGIGEVGLDYYWSREYEQEQLDAFRQQIEWSIDLRLPLMIHCRKAHAEMVALLKEYKDSLVGGVFHCFSGNSHEAAELLRFDNFMLGIGGVVTFKNSHVREALAQTVPMERIVLETDSPYLAPVPMRGQRNESANLKYICQTLADIYAVSTDEIDMVTNENTRKVFGPLCGIIPFPEQ